MRKHGSKLLRREVNRQESKQITDHAELLRFTKRGVLRTSLRRVGGMVDLQITDTPKLCFGWWKAMHGILSYWRKIIVLRNAKLEYSCRG